MVPGLDCRQITKSFSESDSTRKAHGTFRNAVSLSYVSVKQASDILKGLIRRLAVEIRESRLDAGRYLNMHLLKGHKKIGPCSNNGRLLAEGGL